MNNKFVKLSFHLYSLLYPVPVHAKKIEGSNLRKKLLNSNQILNISSDKFGIAVNKLDVDEPLPAQELLRQRMWCSMDMKDELKFKEQHSLLVQKAYKWNSLNKYENRIILVTCLKHLTKNFYPFNLLPLSPPCPVMSFCILFYEFRISIMKYSISVLVQSFDQTRSGVYAHVLAAALLLFWPFGFTFDKCIFHSIYNL